MMKRYGILPIRNSNRLIIRDQNDPANDMIKFVASLEDVCGIVKAASEGIGHGGDKKIQ